MPLKLPFNDKKIQIGSILRRVLPYFHEEGFFFIDDQMIHENNLIYGDVISIGYKLNESFLIDQSLGERTYNNNGSHIFQIEKVVLGPIIVPVGQRFSSQSFCGGIMNPISFQNLKPIKSGEILDLLTGINLAGRMFINCSSQVPSKIRVTGVLVDKNGKALSLKSYKEVIPQKNEQFNLPSGSILVVGTHTNCGKTSLVSEIVNYARKCGISVSVEKKTGGPRIKDWITPFFPELDFTKEGTNVEFKINEFQGRDFTDAVGVASSRTEWTPDVVKESVKYTLQLRHKLKTKVHLIEIAGPWSTPGNIMILRALMTHQQIELVLLVGIRTHSELYAACHFFLESLKLKNSKLIVIIPNEASIRLLALQSKYTWSHKIIFSSESLLSVLKEYLGDVNESKFARISN